MRVLIADDHPVFRQGLKALLEKDGFDVVGAAADGHEAVALASRLHPDVAVLDIAMPGLNGIDAAREMHRQQLAKATVLLTMHTEDHYVLEALRSGVKGYVLKSQAPQAVADAIRQAARGGVYMSPGISRILVDAYVSKREPAEEVLSRRERQVLQLVAEGKTTKEIAQVLDISVKTADSHRGRLMKKLDIHETAGLVRYAIRRGVILP
jgi:two-component system, NarL family, response regulator NreC